MKKLKNVEIEITEIKDDNSYPKYYKNTGNNIYASYDGVGWFWYGNTECC